MGNIADLTGEELDESEEAFVAVLIRDREVFNSLGLVPESGERIMRVVRLLEALPEVVRDAIADDRSDA